MSRNRATSGAANGAPVCAAFAATPQSTFELNRDCECWSIDTHSIRAALSRGVQSTLGASQQHLFAATGVFLHSADMAAMCDQIDAIESVVQLPGYVEASGAPAIQACTRGVLMGYDFHLTPTGPRLIEINTNAGGAFLTHAMHNALQLPSVTGLSATTMLTQMLQSEWLQAGRAGVPQTIAIVDDDPASQYLYGDMLAATELLQQRFNRVVVVAAEDLRWSGSTLSAKSLDGISIDMVYNRHTDFALVDSTVQALRAAWLADRVVVSPSPRHHALYANKRNLRTLGDLEQLAGWGAADEQLEVLSAIVPTVDVTAANASSLWEQRRGLFFKPLAGFGGRATYRGAKLTKRVWARILSGADGGYVAQKYVPAPTRCLARSEALNLPEPQNLKYDVRLYTYGGAAVGVVARLYRGQTTNFRTPGGGFAPVALLND